jgi:3',5'-nucleoside bisphosphate phosphatase
MKKIVSLFALALTISFTNAQRKLNDLPDIPGYITLKADFHVHTVFSDGEVWPTFRVDEAAREGIDVIALTDHIEYVPHKKYLRSDHNSSYEVAHSYAQERNILLIKAVEVTREMPTGHFNVLFVKDANKLDTADFMTVMQEANNQGAFVFWNHPGWKKQQPDGVPKFHPIHEELLKRKWLHGVEFYNTKCAWPYVLDWCRERKLTVFSNSDVHIAASDYWEFEKGGRRPVTLVFAKSKNEESVKEALQSRRTLALFSGDSLAGDAALAEAFFKACIQIKKPHYDANDNEYIEIINSSSVPFYLHNILAVEEPKTIVLKPKTANRVALKKSSPAEQSFAVRNILIGPGKYLQTRITLK